MSMFLASRIREISKAELALKSQMGEDEKRTECTTGEAEAFGVVVLGFPYNHFEKQEQGENSEVLFGLKYVHSGSGFIPSFQFFEKGNVNGEKEQKVSTFLKNSCPPTSDLLTPSSQLFWESIKVHDICWNFEKFLVAPDGIPVMCLFYWDSVSAVKSNILEYLKQFNTE
ncbi:LOW QUALITY PROTEIN: glutathione peroxidase 6-like [Rhinolophus ferrumequinum]|uniref:LOW QUALITY PROTEIN: glutathione peroxidase 6-like n=1 Tax=Rhinolophus ferrumequinum TaxID=59479 RepID=UPI00140F8D12|nr:LOW QUALITY PROTEIN: glutathione peroxidase 6-like [Rhinolophus ferrumequinum]